MINQGLTKGKLFETKMSKKKKITKCKTAEFLLGSVERTRL